MLNLLWRDYQFKWLLKTQNMKSNHCQTDMNDVAARRELLLIIDNQDYNGRVTSQLSPRLAAGALRRVR